MAQNPVITMQQTQQSRQLTAHLFDDKAKMAKAIAAAIAESILQYASQNNTPMTIALAGGETPKPAYRHLAKMQLPWHRLEFIATDERITADKTRSNEKMLVNILGQKAQVCKLQENTPAPNLHLALLGIGADGHTASLFADAMPKANSTTIQKVAPATTTEERLTLPLTSFTATPRLLLIITGEQKWQLLSRPPSSKLPITTLLANRKTPAEVFYAPD